jgi:hypothetical protein
MFLSETALFVTTLRWIGLRAHSKSSPAVPAQVSFPECSLTGCRGIEGLLWVRCSRSDRPVNVGSRSRKRTKRLRLRSAMKRPSALYGLADATCGCSAPVVLGTSVTHRS